MKKKINNKAFTLIELLAVIIILMLILMIGVPAISRITVKSKQRAFFISVSNIVDSVGSQSLFDDKNKCIYYYEYDKEELPSEIAALYIIVRPSSEDGRAIYGVYAEQYENERAIDIGDFSKIKKDDTSTWAYNVDSPDSATWLVASLITNFVNTNNNSSDIIDYKLCSKIY